jgi:flagellar motor switch protein FliN/FliY
VSTNPDTGGDRRARDETAADPRPGVRLGAVDVEISGVLGEAVVPLADLLGWLPGLIVPLDRSVGMPAEVCVEGTTVAHAEIVVVDERYALRITDVITGAPARAVRHRQRAAS